MTHLDNELGDLRNNLIEMFLLVQKQLRKSMQALEANDQNLAREVLFNERRVNAEELKIDRECENITALFNPVAIDLRFVFASFKINSHLESIGDSAKGISKCILESNSKFDPDLLRDLQLLKMYEIASSMIEDNMYALQHDDTNRARAVFNKDVQLDSINRDATGIIASYISKENAAVMPLLNMISIVRRIERVGDLSSNISEEIIFYVEAKVLKHEKEKS